MTEAEKASYLARREKLIDILDWLVGQWDLAEWLVALLGSNFVTIELIDGIEKILLEAIKTVKDDQVKEKLQAWVDKIRQLKEEEIREWSAEKEQVESGLLKELSL